MKKFLSNKVETFYGRIGMVFTGIALYSIYIKAFMVLNIAQFFIEGQIGMTYDQKFIRACIIAPFWEELTYRYGPLMIARAAGEDKYTMPVMIVASIIFGQGHGGYINIFIQGVLGMMLSIVFVKSNYKIWVPMLMHFIWNFICLRLGL